MKLYGLYSNKKKCLMAANFSANDGELCNDVEINLSKYFDGDTLWVAPNKSVAEDVAEKGSTEWYNAGWDSPNWSEDYYGKLDVVCLNDFS